MAYPPRAAVYDALFARLIKLTEFTSFTRHAVLPSQVTVQNSPLLSLLEGNTRTTYDANRLRRDEWDATIVFFFRKEDLSTPGATIVNPLIDAVRDALQPDDPMQEILVLRDPQTRAQLASWVRVEGETFVENGDTDPEGVGGALIPVRMLVP